MNGENILIKRKSDVVKSVLIAEFSEAKFVFREVTGQGRIMNASEQKMNASRQKMNAPAQKANASEQKKDASR